MRWRSFGIARLQRIRAPFLPDVAEVIQFQHVERRIDTLPNVSLSQTAGKQTKGKRFIFSFPK